LEQGHDIAGSEARDARTRPLAPGLALASGSDPLAPTRRPTIDTIASGQFVANAFDFPNYRRFFVGSVLSNIGTWFQILAQALLILKLTGEGASLGAALAIQTLPLLLFGPFIGPFLDRVDIRRLLLVISAISGLEAGTLGVLVTTGHVNLVTIYILSGVLGLAQMFQMPSNQTIISELVPTEAIPSAVSYATIQQSIGRLAGPAAAALIFAWQGAAVCYFANAFSYAVVVCAVLSLRKDELFPRPIRERSPRQFVDAISYVWHSPAHRGQLIANTFVGIFSFNFQLFFSSFTQLVLHAGAVSLGIAESTNALFAVIGGLYLAHRKLRPTRKTYIAACFGMGISLSLAASAPNFVLFDVAMGIFGFAIVFYQTVNQTSLQLNTPRDRIGSVMTLSTFGLQGTTPIGSLVMGWIISVASARAGLGVGGIASIIAGGALLIALARSPAPMTGPIDVPADGP
jgi:MFS family permease